MVTGLLGLATGRPLAKPLISGTDDAPTDVQRLRRWSGQDPAVFQAWRTPVAPHRAALLEGEPLDVEALRRWIVALPADAIVEGVGGWRVPLSAGFEQVDLARLVGPRVLVVAADRLGVLNHTRLTVDAVRADGFEVVAVVLNAIGSDASTPWNREDLGACLDVPVVSLGPVDEARPAANAAAAHALAVVLGFGPSETPPCP